jgi:bifunctional non-homologous end joining protein LigD
VDQQITIEGRTLKLTRLEKVLYPSGFTKAEVIDYYVRVAPFLIPHLRSRPLTLKRYPDGVEAPAYWEKDAPSFTPEWVERFPVPRHGGGPEINYILANNTATLAWAANVAALELHPFLHRAPDLNTPTSVVFDLDPGEGADILTCIEVALQLSGVFDRLGLQLFPKVSGSKGLQVYLPLNTRASYEITQPFARSIAQLIEAANPNLAVSEMPKEKRVGKVFIDWSQNADFKTTVGVYSLRAKQKQPFVSMPVTWAELRTARRKKDAAKLYFAPKQALARLDKLGDLFAPALSLEQQLPADVVEQIREQNTRSPHPTSKPQHDRRSPEDVPVPRRSAQGSRRRFVIQRHAASRPHYDFRLEMNGVLRSWAVPKGLPYEPGVRRLANATEDHPLSYLAFEGIIPEGQYGAGTVMVWDIGAYEIVEGNYWKGYLQVSLSGRKLHGEWKLTRDSAKGKTSWLIEKLAPGVETPGDSENSALTGRTIEQIAAARDAEWQSNRPSQTSTETSPIPFPELMSLPEIAPAFIEPMQCKLVGTLPEGDQWQYEAKFDGYRALITRDRELAILSRRNNSLTSDFPAIAKALEALPDGTVIDGEIIALD